MSVVPVRPQDPCRVSLLPIPNSGEGHNLRCDLTFRIEVGEDEFVPLDFRVDTGASRSSMALLTAEEYGLPIPGPETERLVEFTKAGEAGRRVRARFGRLKVWWGLHRTGDPFDWPMLYIVDAPASMTPLLGLGGVIRDCTWLFDGRPDDESLFGRATFTDVRGDAAE